MERPEIIRIDHVSKRFVVNKEKSIKDKVVNFRNANTHKTDYWALKDVGFSIAAGESVGLVGPNGSGKSTLLKVIGGILAPDKGQVYLRGRVAALLELGAGFHPDLTGRENVYLNGAILGLSEEEIDREFENIVEFSGIAEFIDTQVKFYSSGMYVRLAFAVAVHSDPDILLVDEVLAVGDEPFQQKCMERIRQFQREGRSIILVSHSAEQIIDVCDRAVVLEQGKVIKMDAARPAMRFLHERYQEAARIALGLHDGEDVRMASIVSTETTSLDTDENGDTYYASGDPLEFVIRVDVHRTLESPALIVDLMTDRGRHVLGLDTRHLPHQLPTLHEGPIDLRVSFPEPHIGGGTYTMSVSLLDSHGFEVDVVHEALTLPVRTEKPTGGVIAADAHVSVTPAPKP